jgi:hypothetical protein
MSYTPGQQQVINRIIAIGKKRGAGPKAIKAAIETGSVESNFNNLPGGDADSQGWRQERASIYKDPRNLDASINRFYDEAAPRRRQYGSAGALAAAVQRPAAQYRGRYQQHSTQADQILGAFGGGVTPTSGNAGQSDITETTHSFDRAGYNKARGLAILGQHLAKRNPNNPLLKFGVVGTQAPDITQFEHTNLETLTGPKLSQGIQSRGYSSTTADLIARANQVNAHHLPYAWGGGHAGKTDPSQGVPVDCSGAVSEVLGIDPRVAADFEKFGKPGVGRVTIYAKDTHVIMSINGHFFGTSASNPGGGAGWIPRSAISSQYLKGFTARHIDA